MHKENGNNKQENNDVEANAFKQILTNTYRTYVHNTSNISDRSRAGEGILSMDGWTHRRVPYKCHIFDTLADI